MVDGVKVNACEIEVLDYPACPGETALEWNGWAEVDEKTSASIAGHDRGTPGARAGAGCSETDTESVRRSFEDGRAKGREEGRQLEREAHAAHRNAEAERQNRQLAGFVARFSEETERYLREVECEVVRLSLAVASRILRREAQMDPLLLTGAVRVALGQLAASSEARLLVPAAELELWREAIAHLPHLAVKPVVARGEGMLLGDCRIECRMGTVDLGVRAQLAEIERGFFDRIGGEAGAAQEAEPVPNLAPDEEKR